MCSTIMEKIPSELVCDIVEFLGTVQEVANLASVLGWSVRERLLPHPNRVRHLRDKLVQHIVQSDRPHLIPYVLGSDLVKDLEVSEEKLFGVLCYGKKQNNQEAPWDEDTAYCAARYGSFPLLKWLVEEGCPCNKDVMCAAAAAGGHLDTLKWLVCEQNFPVDSWVWRLAENNSHRHVVKWVDSVFFPSGTRPPLFRVVQHV